MGTLLFCKLLPMCYYNSIKYYYQQLLHIPPFDISKLCTDAIIGTVSAIGIDNINAVGTSTAFFVYTDVGSV